MKNKNENITAAEISEGSETVVKKTSRINKKHLKYGTLATAITVIFIAVVVLINVIVGIAMDRHPLKIDLTSNKLYEISDQTIDYLKNLQSDVDITVMSDEASYKSNTNYKTLSEVLEKYAQYSDKINLKYADIQKNPDEVSKYSANYSGEIAENSVVIASGDKVRVSTSDNMLVLEANYSTYQYDIKGIKAEQVLTSAVMYVTDSNPKKVGFISADYHSANSYAFNGIINLMYSNGYEMDLNDSSGIDRIDLTTQDISDDYDLIVLFAPLNDLTTTAVDKLQVFLDNNGQYGKNMLYIGDVYQNLTPNLDTFLEEWGFKLGRSVVQESDTAKQQYVTLSSGSKVGASLGTIAEETYSAGLSSTALPLVVPYARPIDLLWESNTGRTTEALLKTSGTSYLYPLTSSENETASTDISETETSEETTTEAETTFNADDAEKSEQVVMAVGTKNNNDVSASSKLMVISSAAIADYSIMSSKAYNNSEYLINAVNIMAGKNSGITVADKTFNDNTITISQSQINGLRIVVIVIIPLIVIAVGIFIYVRRRNR